MNKQELMDKCNILIEKASNYLYEDKPEKALEIGNVLEKLRHSSSFSIQAMAYNYLEQPEEAIKALNKGLIYDPTNWNMWQMLANNYAEQDSFEPAYKALDQALHIENSDKIALNYNYAIILCGDEKFEKAEDKLNLILNDKDFPQNTTPSLNLLINSLRYSLLNRKKQYNEVNSLYEKEEQNILALANEFPFEAAKVFFEVAMAYWNLKNIQQTEFYLKQTVICDKFNEQAHWLYREMRIDEKKENLKHYNIMVKGKWFEPIDNNTANNKLPNFYVRYEVVAENEEEAVSIIKYFEPDKVADSIKIYESKVIKETTDQPKGVYLITNYDFEME